MALDEKIKELVAVGASITANCQPCLQFHVEKAVKFGADPQEVAAAVEVGKRVRKGASGKMDDFSATLSPAAAGGTNPACCG